MNGHENKSVLDEEAAFVCWYNNGRRRSYRQVATIFDVSGKTVGRAAWDHDWEGRAERLDRDAQAIVDAKLVALRARSMTQLAELATAELAKFARRQPQAVRDESGALLDNPYLSKKREQSIADLLPTLKLFDAAGLISARSDQDGDEDLRLGLQEMRESVAEMYLRDEEERVAAEGRTEPAKAHD